MKGHIRTIAILILLFNLAQAQSTRQVGTKRLTEASANTQPAAAASSVTGSGTAGRLSKWTGVSGSNTFVLGDSIIFEDKFGKLGIGTTTPTSPLTVQGMIETTMGGYKFPDGTIQPTAAVSGLQSIFHDPTLTGNGTGSSPLGVAIPLILSGAASDNGVVVAVNTGLVNGHGLIATGGNKTTDEGIAGDGVIAAGGKSIGINLGFVSPGAGLRATGGSSDQSTGGGGVVAVGGSSALNGGSGVVAMGGEGRSGSVNGGGDGVSAAGGDGIGANVAGGVGIRAIGGFGQDGGPRGFAGLFSGDVEITEDLNVTGTKNFKIDHPLDPDNKYLYHAAIESSEVLNVYSGNIKLDANGEARVKLPEWFEALNKDFRYSLTSIGAPSQGLYIAEEVSNNQFKIAGGLPGAKVSWQVTGIRSDAAMHKHPFKSEEDKPERERGYYLSPEAFNQPEERGVEWSRDPQMMQQLKQRRIEAEQTRKTPPPNQH